MRLHARHPRDAWQNIERFEHNESRASFGCETLAVEDGPEEMEIYCQQTSRKASFEAFQAFEVGTMDS